MPSMRGAGLWSGWGAGRWTVAVLAVLALTGVVVVATGEETVERHDAAPGTTSLPATTTSTVPEPTTTVAVTQPVPSSTTTTTGRPATTTTLPSPPTTIACRDSADPACGRFRWDPQPPPNQVLSVSVTVSPIPTAVGEVVSFHVVAEDADGRIGRRSVDYGDGTGDATGGQPDCPGPVYGPWTPPPPTPERVETTYQHVYSGPGNFTVVFRFRSYGPCPDPAIYGNEGQVTVPLVVSPRV